MTDRYAVYCISAGRPTNVERVTEMMHPYPVTWVVPVGEAYEYRACGAEDVRDVPVPEGVQPLPFHRNYALDDAFANGRVCIETDDDPKSFQILVGDKKAEDATLDMYLREWQTVRDNEPHTYLYGVGNMSNPYFATRTIRRQLIFGGLIAVWPSPERFPLDMAVAEDIDFTLQHLHHHRSVARLEWLLASYLHATNRGGVQRYRDETVEKDAVQQLLTRWPDYLRPTTRGPHGVALKRGIFA
jgi:hypothetical protein